MIRKVSSWTAAHVAAVMALATAQTTAPSAAQQPADQAQIDQGKITFAQKCSHCHGPNMVNPGTSSFDLRKFPHDNRERFVNSVTRGKNTMPAWGDMLQPEEISAIWAYVLSGGKQ